MDVVVEVGADRTVTLKDALASRREVLAAARGQFADAGTGTGIAELFAARRWESEQEERKRQPQESRAPGDSSP